jgi:CBS domain-containing protein
MAEVFVASGFDMQHAEKEVLEVLQTVEESTKESIHELESAMYDVLANLIQDGIPTDHTIHLML